MSTQRPRQPRRRFLSPTGVRSTPMRELPIAADEPEMIDRIKAATSIRDEPEVIGPAILNSYAESNAFKHTQQHMADVLAAQQIRPAIEAEDRLKDIHRRAKHARVDLSHEIGIMRRDLDKARQRGAQPKPHTLHRLTNIEGLLDGIAA
jgi:hypothetical protein